MLRAGRLVQLGVLALSLFVLALAATPPRAAAQTPRAETFGMNPGDLFRLPEAEWDVHLRLLSSQGVKVMRLGAWWSDLEPAPPVAGRRTYAWGDVDRQVAALARHGIRWEPLLCFSTTWGSRIEGDYTAAPANPDDFAAFGAALAQRYGPGGSFWREHPELQALPVQAYEVWNEQNAPVFWHPADRPAEDYADLYAATRSAIHAVDGDARVVVGGLAAAKDGVMAPEEFLRRMLAHRPELRGSLDAVGLHPYGRDPDGVAAKVVAFRRALDALAGPGVPIEVTEIGWTATDVPEGERAARLEAVASMLPLSDCGVDRVMPYAWIGPERDASDREQWFGLATAAGVPRASALGYAAAIARVMAAPSGPSVRLCGDAAPAPSPGAGDGAAATRAGLGMAMRVAARKRRVRPTSVLVRTRCTKGCRIEVTVRVLRPRAFGARAAAAGGVLLIRRRAAVRHRQQHRIAVPLGRRTSRRGLLLQVQVVAVGRDGTSTTRVRSTRVR